VIERIEGEVLDLSHVRVLLKVGPVVLRIWTVPRGIPDRGKHATLWTHLVVGDSLDLYGFADLQDREIFLRLLKIPGVGPQTALRVLAEAPAEALLQAVAKDDTRFFSRIPGVGKKRALRILAELKDEAVLPPAPSGVFEALIALGLTPREAREALHEAMKEIPEGDEAALLRKALELRSPT